jgi:DNA-binding ferritin-like protein
MASQKALEGLGATADTVSERLNQLGRESVEGIGGEEFIDFLSSGNFNEMTEGEINTYSAYSDD